MGDKCRAAVVEGSLVAWKANYVRDLLMILRNSCASSNDFASPPLSACFGISSTPSTLPRCATKENEKETMGEDEPKPKENLKVRGMCCLRKCSWGSLVGRKSASTLHRLMPRSCDSINSARELPAGTSSPLLKSEHGEVDQSHRRRLGCFDERVLLQNCWGLAGQSARECSKSPSSNQAPSTCTVGDSEVR